MYIYIYTYLHIYRIYTTYTPSCLFYIQTFKVSTVSTLRLLAKVSACPAEAATAARCCALKAPVKGVVEAACEVVSGGWAESGGQIGKLDQTTRDPFI